MLEFDLNGVILLFLANFEITGRYCSNFEMKTLDSIGIQSFCSSLYIGELYCFEGRNEEFKVDKFLKNEFLSGVTFFLTKLSQIGNASVCSQFEKQ